MIWPMIVLVGAGVEVVLSASEAVSICFPVGQWAPSEEDDVSQLLATLRWG